MAASKITKAHKEWMRWRHPFVGLLLILIGFGLHIVNVVAGVSSFVAWSPITLIIFGACLALEIQHPPWLRRDAG